MTATSSRLQVHVVPVDAPPVATRMVLAVLRSHRFRYHDELGLQDCLERVLAAGGVEVDREVRLSDGERIDLTVPTSSKPVGIEVKVGGALADVTRQCERYLRTASLSSLILVTNRVRHAKVPAELDELVGAELVQMYIPAGVHVVCVAQPF